MNHIAALRRRYSFIRDSASLTRICLRPRIVIRLTRPNHTRTISVLPEVFPSVGFETLPLDNPVAEEKLPGYKAERYYPARIGQVLNDRYQIVGKLGFAGGSTVWACRDPEYVFLMHKAVADYQTDTMAAVEKISCRSSRSAPQATEARKTPCGRWLSPNTSRPSTRRIILVTSDSAWSKTTSSLRE